MKLTTAQDQAMNYVGQIGGLIKYGSGGSVNPPRIDVLVRLKELGLITVRVAYRAHARKIDRVQWFPKLTAAGREYLNSREGE